MAASANIPICVPHGTVPGRILSFILISDLANSVADDFKVAGADLKEDIEAVKAWLLKWDLPLNLTKCQKVTPG